MNFWCKNRLNAWITDFLCNWSFSYYLSFKVKKYSSSYLNIFTYLNRDLEGAYVFLKGNFGPTFRTIKTFGSLWILLSSESFWSLGTDFWFSVWSEWILPFAFIDILPSYHTLWPIGHILGDLDVPWMNFSLML